MNSCIRHKPYGVSRESQRRGANIVRPIIAMKRSSRHVIVAAQYVSMSSRTHPTEHSLALTCSIHRAFLTRRNRFLGTLYFLCPWISRASAVPRGRRSSIRSSEYYQKTPSNEIHLRIFPWQIVCPFAVSRSSMFMYACWRIGSGRFLFTFWPF